MSSLIWDADDFGSNHIISDMCQSHDCRDKLDEFHYANPNFKATLFAIPREMTLEILEWCKANSSWVELCVHGFSHSSNYECEKITYEEFDQQMKEVAPIIDKYFVKGFKSPGWQTSNAVFEWLHDNGWFISCQSYDLERLPKGLPAYVNYNGEFKVHYKDTITDVGQSSHHHTWNCVGNGVYEQHDIIMDRIRDVEQFKFVSEVINENS